MSFETLILPVEKKEKSKTLKDLRADVEEVGGLWKVDGVEVMGETIYAFYISPEQAEGIEIELKDIGYEPEDDLENEYVFPDTGKYTKIPMPDKTYFFRVAEKK